jgi:uncharacterized SAM-dependent methyltransferase
VAYTLDDPYPSWTEAQVLTAYGKLLQEKAAGKSIIAAGSGDVNKQDQILASLEQRERDFQRSLYAKNPDDYAGYAEIGQNVTLVAFS